MFKSSHTNGYAASTVGRPFPNEDSTGYTIFVDPRYRTESIYPDEYIMSMPTAASKHIGITSILLALAIITVAFRFLAHRRTRTEPGIDDWTLCVALALVFGIYVEGLIWVLFGGIGEHITELSPSQITILLKCFLVCYITYGATFVATKVYILLFYIRVFPLRGLRIACAIVGCLVVALGMSICIVGCLMCRPFAYFWNKSIVGGKCLSRHPVFYIPAVSTLLLNIVVVCLPMPAIWFLHMKRAHRIALIAVFSLGAMVCVAGIIWICSISTFDTADLSYTLTTAALLVVVEPCVAIISVCLPGIQPVLSDIASYLTIEHMKMGARIQTAINRESASDVETAMVYNAPWRPPSPTTKSRPGYQQEHGGQVTEASSDYEDGDEDLYPDGPVMIRGRLMNV
ncbi:MAG: hypothetical protein Q9184_000253 [Pyrenodesmia sp. 2 TL-2023]